MAKCDFQIVFDRQDRSFRPGEPIRGTVHLEVYQDFTCNRLAVEHFWRAHGRGNTAEGPRTPIVLGPTEFRSGDSISLPFEFVAPDGPPTYHGNHLNVDQYVSVRAEIPWAFDPKHEEDYLLSPGSRDWGNRPAAGPGRAAQNTSGAWVVTIFGIVFLVIGLATFCVFGFIFAAIGAAMIFFGQRNAMAERKIGQVDLHWDTLETPPGESFPLRIRLVPRKAVAINVVTCRLVGKEQCVSGSGTDKTTHTHIVHQRTTTLASDISAAPGQPLEWAARLEIPETTAYSFEASDNKLIWSVEVRIDIPNWPDWMDEVTLLVRPRTTAAPAEVPRDAEILPADRLEPRPTALAPESALAPLWPEPQVAPLDFERPPPISLPPTPAPAYVPVEPIEPLAPLPKPVAAMSLAELARQLAEAPRYGSEREKVVAEHVGETFDFAMEVSSVERSFGSVPEAFRNGRTVIGTLAGAECKISVQMPAARNEQMQALESGRSLPVRATLLKWNVIYDRLELRSADS